MFGGVVPVMIVFNVASRRVRHRAGGMIPAGTCPQEYTGTKKLGAAKSPAEKTPPGLRTSLETIDESEHELEFSDERLIILSE